MILFRFFMEIGRNKKHPAFLEILSSQDSACKSPKGPNPGKGGKTSRKPSYPPGNDHISHQTGKGNSSSKMLGGYE